MRLAFPLAVFICFALACAPPDNQEYKVTYTVDGPLLVDVTYKNEDGGTEMVDDVRTPWTKTFTAKSGHFLYVSAQNTGSSSAVTVKIEAGGKVKTANSRGEYAIATIYGRCCLE